MDLIVGVVIGVTLYITLLVLSYFHSCAGYDFRECGFCWVGIVHLPFEMLFRLKDKLKKP